MRLNRRHGILCLLALGLSSCAVGPDFHTPRLPPVKQFMEKPFPKTTQNTPSLKVAGNAQTFIAKDIPADWYHLYRSKELNALINQALSHNQNLVAAYAALRQAQANYNSQLGSTLFPAVAGNLLGQRQLSSSATTGGLVGSSLFNLYNTNVSVSYVLDVFGGERRQLEALKAQIDYSQFQLIAAYLTMAGNIATTAISVASYEEQIAATKDLIRFQRDDLDILQKQFDLGAISKINVMTQETLLQQTRATLPPLEKSLSQSKHALAVLVGQYPDAPLPALHLDSFILPNDLPITVPSRLTRQRPDVRASEALLHAASAQIGVATANMFPQITLAGNYGWEALSPSQLFKPATQTWALGGTLVQTLFQGGALYFHRKAAVAAYDQALAQYRQTVLQGFQNTADALRAVEADARLLNAMRRAELAAANELKLTQGQYRLGGTSYLNLLTAQTQYQQTRLARIQAQAARLQDTAALFQALGGGWWNQTWCVKECLTPA